LHQRHALYDAVVVGAGPNGLSAAIELARSGYRVRVLEAQASPGGGARSGELTLPGFVHDVCSSIHPLGIASPFFRSLGLERYGLTWLQPPAPLAHLLDPSTALTLERSVDETAEQLGCDGPAYRKWLGPLVAESDRLVGMLLGPLRAPADSLLYLRFGFSALQSMVGMAHRRFSGKEVGGLLAGLAAHAMAPLEASGTAAFAMVLAIAGHAVGWPVAKGGSQAITNALVACLRELGGEIAVDTPVRRMADLPAAKAYLFDVTPRQLLAITGDELPSGFRRRLARFRYGPGVFKMDWALGAPIPWKASACGRAATVHLAGDLEQISAAEAVVHAGQIPDHPFVLVAQPSLFDTRAPPGQHTAWAYCHVPNSYRGDLSGRIEQRIEAHAPGFRDLILARAMRGPAALEAYDANYVGGDINGGLASLKQMLFRPVIRLDPYSTPSPRIFLCSSSTPPGGGVHGMCGYWAARSAIRRALS
jgi:phytoene dehydrogenase-like protein